ncbi:hypothetical protein K8I61_09945 [bacterium]|nr:hypothetical protein [bacterium]
MKKLWWLSLVAMIAALFTMSALLVACGDDDDDDDDGGDDDDDDDDDVGTGEPGTLSGFVHDFQTKQPVAGALVEVLNDETGEPFDPPIEATSPSGDAKVSFDIPEGHDQVGIRVSKEGATDTVQFHFDVGLANEEFLLIANATRELVALSLGIELDLTKAVMAGGVYYGDPIDEDAIGCAEVSFDPDDGQNVFYFGPDALPTAARNVTGDTPANGQGTNPGYDGKGQAISYYVSLNKEIDSNITLTGRVYDDEGTGTVENSVEETGLMPRLYPNTASIANVYYSRDDYDSNPTRPWCTQ